MKKVNPAVKSMALIGLYLIATIVIWMFVAKVLFPTTESADTVDTLVENNAPLLTQIAENNADPTQWEGIDATDTVKEFLEEAKVASISTENGLTRFYFETDANSPTDTKALVYAPDDAYAAPDFAAGWAQIATESADTFRWEGGAEGKGYVTVRKIAEHFYYEETCQP